MLSRLVFNLSWVVYAQNSTVVFHLWHFWERRQNTCVSDNLRWATFEQGAPQCLNKVCARLVQGPPQGSQKVLEKLGPHICAPDQKSGLERNQDPLVGWRVCLYKMAMGSITILLAASPQPRYTIQITKDFSRHYANVHFRHLFAGNMQSIALYPI